jgi:hypothetical protein
MSFADEMRRNYTPPATPTSILENRKHCVCNDLFKEIQDSSYTKRSLEGYWHHGEDCYLTKNEDLSRKFYMIEDFGEYKARILNWLDKDTTRVYNYILYRAELQSIISYIEDELHEKGFKNFSVRMDKVGTEKISYGDRKRRFYERGFNAKTRYIGEKMPLLCNQHMHFNEDRVVLSIEVPAYAIYVKVSW